MRSKANGKCLNPTRKSMSTLRKHEEASWQKEEQGKYVEREIPCDGKTPENTPLCLLIAFQLPTAGSVRSDGKVLNHYELSVFALKQVPKPIISGGSLNGFLILKIPTNFTIIPRKYYVKHRSPMHSFGFIKSCYTQLYSSEFLQVIEKCHGKDHETVCLFFSMAQLPTSPCNVKATGRRGSGVRADDDYE